MVSDRDHLYDVLQNSIAGNLEFENPELTGFSGRKMIGLLQGFAKHLSRDECYLEVGVFQGLTLLSVAAVIPEFQAFGIDNFKQFDSEGQNQLILKNRMQALGIKNANIINDDYEDALRSLGTLLDGKKIGLYFIDGPHDYRSQILCLMLVLPWLSDKAIIVVDDSNYHHVRQANQDFLRIEPDFKLIFESYTEIHPNNLTGRAMQLSRDQWWNGVNVMIRDRENRYNSMYPETSRNRILFENDHLLHGSKYPLYLPEAAYLMNVIRPLQPLKLINRILRLKKKLGRQSESFTGKFDRLNTFSEGLPIEHINPSLKEKEL